MSYNASTNYTSLSSNYPLILPEDQGASGEVMSNDGAGNLSWAVSGGAVDVTWTSPNALDIYGDTTAAGLTSGSNNMLIGVGTSALTTGSSNVCIAPLAGNSITTGSSNMNIGSNAGTAISTGGFNINIGNAAGFTNTTSTGQVNIGTNAGKALTVSYGVNLGYNAGSLLTTSAACVNIGRDAGTVATTANIVAIGEFSGAAITTEADCTFLGHSTTGLVGGVNQTVLGKGATGTVANQIMMGNASVAQIVPHASATCVLGTAVNKFSDVNLSGGVKFHNGATAGTTLTGGANTTDLSLTLPIVDGTNGQVLQTNGSGVLSFATASGGGGGGGLFAGTLCGGTNGLFVSRGIGYAWDMLNVSLWTENPRIGAYADACWDGTSRWVCLNPNTKMSFSDDDGATWTTATTVAGATSAANSRVNYDASTSDWVYAGSGTSEIMYSSDAGVTWQAPTTITQPTSANGCCNNGAGTWVMSGTAGATVSYSTDIRNTVSNHGVSVMSAAYSCAHGNGIFVVGGVGVVYACPEANVATLGSWVAATGVGILSAIRGIAYSSTLGIWVIGGASSNVLAWSDDDCATFTSSQKSVSSVFTDVRDVCWDGTHFIASNHDSIGDVSVAYSIDGKKWDVRDGQTAPTSGNLPTGTEFARPRIYPKQ